MKIIVAQNDQNEKQFSLSIKSFFTRFHIGSILREANAYKEKGISAVSVFLYLVSLVFTGRSMYMDYASGNSHPSFGRDVVYRFLNNPHINWMKSFFPGGLPKRCSKLPYTSMVQSLQ